MNIIVDPAQFDIIYIIVSLYFTETNLGGNVRLPFGKVLGSCCCKAAVSLKKA